MADSAAKKKKPAYELEISLKLYGGDANRVLVVGANITFKRLHEIIQAAYCWHDSHLFNFTLYEKDWQGEPSVEIVYDKELKAESQAKIARLAHRAKLSEFLDDYKFVLYVYDFGDNWEHAIRVAKFYEDYSGELPVLLSGEGDAPPEDCGGDIGYADFLKIMKSPRHKEHKETKQWAKGQGWQPFDYKKASLRVFWAGNPGRGVWLPNDRIGEFI
jgi:hypothetical protein